MNLQQRAARWAKLHEQQDIDRLTGSDPEHVLDLHGLQRPIGKKVADIGYGTGTMSRYLRPDNDVTSFDIADLDGVAPIATLREQSFDLAICHLVAQHNSPEDIPMLVPRLRENGRFTIQFAAIGNRSEYQGDIDWLHDPDTFHHLLRPLSVVERRNIIFTGNKKAEELEKAGASWWVFVCEKAKYRPRTWRLTAEP